MSFVLKDRVKETSTTTGTGTFTLAGAATGFQSFSVIGNGNSTFYCIVDSAAGAWEVGIGTYTSSGTTLSRDTILESSNSGSKVNFSAGTKEVFCTYPAEKSVTLDDVQTLSNKTLASPSVTGAITFPDSSTQNTAATGFGFKNRIINGDMRIDQRNAGASVTPTNGAYTLDRWTSYLTQASKFTVQQNAGSVTPPVGFKNYLGVTSSSSYSVGAGDIFAVYQLIEGFNISDLGWGTADAKAVTLSFQVRSSLTGTFGGALRNSAWDRVYPFTYTISSANTWTSISVTIAGDTSGTWLTTNGIGLGVILGLGVGSTYSGTSGSWSGSTLASATGATSVVGTSGATFYITGVQLEKGNTATSFDYRPYGTELGLCQRYYYRTNSVDLFGGIAMGTVTSSTATSIYMKLSVPMRAQPTITQSSLRSFDGGTAVAVTAISTVRSNYDSIYADINNSAGLTIGRSAIIQGNNSATGYIDASSEL